MHVPRRGRFIGGVAAGAGATAVLGSLLLGSPSGATETMGDTFKPEAIDAVPAAALIDGEQQLVGAAGAGSYVVQRVGDHLTIVTASPASGWTVEVLHNDAGMVKAVFANQATMVFALAKLHDDGMVDVEAFEKAKPVAVAPVVPKAAPAATTDGKVDGEHDGWCDDKDGDRDGFESAGFDGDGDRDGRRDGHDGHRDGGWDGDDS